MQQYGRPVVLSDQQVDGAIVVVVSGDDGARIFELNLVQANIGGDVFEAIGPEIAEEFDLALALFRFTDRDEIDPAVVVVVEGSHAIGADPVRLGKLYLIEGFAMVVVPESQGWRAPLRCHLSKRKVHPAVVIEIENDSCPGHWRRAAPRSTSNKFALS